MVIGIDKGIRSKPYIVAAKKLNIPYKLITCTFNDAINQIRSVDALIWHWTHANYIEKRIAIDIIRSAELMGKKHIQIQIRAGRLMIRYQKSICLSL